ncbi:MAG: hypothetical protein IKV87_05360 [Methanobrevibacter sp.]|nr:hypothetical protein [Methanobrevibacter sp.]
MDMKLIIRFVLLIVGVSTMALGISLSIKACLGTSPIASPPYVLSLAFPISVGTFVIFFNTLMVLFQMVLLREITIKQIAQIPVCILFGYMTDFTLELVSFLNAGDYLSQWILCILSCIVLAFGICLEVKPNLAMLPGDGAVQALAKVTNKEFGQVKPFFDVSIVLLAVVLSFGLLGHLEGVREGTIFAAIVVGFIVQYFDKIFGYKILEYLES